MDSRILILLTFAFCLVSSQEFESDYELSSSLSYSDWDGLGEVCDCENRVCPELPESCPHGMVTAPGDECGCCHTCGNGEWQYCDPDPHEYAEYFTIHLPWEIPPEEPLWDPTYHKFGRCGWGLTCKLRHDLGPQNSQPVFVCLCQDDTIVCGSDGKTYETPCTLREAAVEKGSPLVVEKKEMCIGAPRILSSSKNLTHTIALGKTLSVGCEARSNPPAFITWSKDGKVLKEDISYRHYSIKQRPGPVMYTVTGFLQVFNVGLEDAGTYECVASNEHGFTSTNGTVSVVNSTSS